MAHLAGKCPLAAATFAAAAVVAAARAAVACQRLFPQGQHAADGGHHCERAFAESPQKLASRRTVRRTLGDLTNFLKHDVTSFKIQRMVSAVSALCFARI
jgi:hypothetical protein